MGSEAKEKCLVGVVDMAVEDLGVTTCLSFFFFEMQDLLTSLLNGLFLFALHSNPHVL